MLQDQLFFGRVLRVASWHVVDVPVLDKQDSTDLDHLLHRTFRISGSWSRQSQGVRGTLPAARGLILLVQPFDGQVCQL